MIVSFPSSPALAIDQMHDRISRNVNRIISRSPVVIITSKVFFEDMSQCSVNRAKKTIAFPSS